MSDDNLELLPISEGEYEPATFLRLLSRALEHEKLSSVIAIVLPEDGPPSIHTSSLDRERNLALVSLAQRHCVEMAAESFGIDTAPDEPEPDEIA